MTRRYVMSVSVRCTDQRFKRWVEKLGLPKQAHDLFKKVSSAVDISKTNLKKDSIRIVSKEKVFLFKTNSKIFSVYSVTWKKKHPTGVKIGLYSRTVNGVKFPFEYYEKITAPQEVTEKTGRNDSFLKTHVLVWGVCETCENTEMVWIPKWCEYPVKFKECTMCGNGHLFT